TGDNTFKLGLNISHPLFQRTATAQEEIAQVSLQRIGLQQRLIERQVRAEIDDALSAIAKAEERIRTAEREVRWSEILQQAEVRKFVAGESTLLVVNIRERALADARIRLTNARADYWRATAVYQWATAQL
ncbi:MAG: TolC family protein, partial [Candidatus Kapaibacterium sp.]